MKQAIFVPYLLAASIVLAGCSSGLLNRKSTIPQANNVPTGTSLAMPPDLQLPAPGSGTARVSQPALQDDAVYDTAAAQPAAPATRRSSTGNVRQNCPSGIATADVHECYGINKLKPDGTAKSNEQLSAELKAAILAEKRRTNPSYGTIGNIGAIFRDE
jgi:hypothetical protein